MNVPSDHGHRRVRIAQRICEIHHGQESREHPVAAEPTCQSVGELVEGSGCSSRIDHRVRAQPPQEPGYQFGQRQVQADDQRSEHERDQRIDDQKACEERRMQAALPLPGAIDSSDANCRDDRGPGIAEAMVGRLVVKVDHRPCRPDQRRQPTPLSPSTTIQRTSGQLAPVSLRCAREAGHATASSACRSTAPLPRPRAGLAHWDCTSSARRRG